MEIANETLQPFAKGDFLFARRTFTGRFEVLGSQARSQLPMTNVCTLSELAAPSLQWCLGVSDSVPGLRSGREFCHYCAVQVVHSRSRRLRRSVKRLKKAVCGGKESDGRIHNNEILLPKPTGYTPFSCPREFSKEIDQFPILKT
jgi:hypothetical protein